MTLERGELIEVGEIVHVVLIPAEGDGPSMLALVVVEGGKHSTCRN